MPAAVVLPPKTQEMVHFSVHVPIGTTPRQYLAGITARSAARPKPVTVGSRGRARARAIIIEQATVGVAITVGSLSQMVTRLRIPGVFGTAVGSTARLNIRLRNTGQTFTHAKGRAYCAAAGRRHSFAVRAATILPRDAAVIAVNARGLREGSTVPCRVRLRYGAGLIAAWAGMVALPAPPRGRVVHTGPGVYSVVSSGSGILPWLIGLLAVGVLILAALAVLIHRRRLHPAA